MGLVVVVVGWWECSKGREGEQEEEVRQRQQQQQQEFCERRVGGYK
jgi:hypothetical protein